MRSIAVTLTLALTTLTFAALAQHAHAGATVGVIYSNDTEDGGPRFTGFQPFYRHYLTDVKYDDKMPIYEGDFLTRAMFVQAGLDNRTVGSTGFSETALGVNLDFIGTHESGFGGRVNYHTEDDFDGIKIGALGFGVHYYLGADMRVGINSDEFTFDTGSPTNNDVSTMGINFHWVQSQWSLDANVLSVENGDADAETGFDISFAYFLNPGFGVGVRLNDVDKQSETALWATYAMDKMRMELALGQSDNDGADGAFVRVQWQMAL